jgi:MFS family permease
MISLARYRTLLGDRRLAAAVGTSWVGRLPIGMAVLSILLFVQHAQRSFSLAGIASALYVIGIGAVAPLVGRLIDRFGPRPILWFGAFAYPLALLGLFTAVKGNAGTVAVAACAFMAGVTLPPVPTCVRTLLRRLLTDAKDIQAAYSLDSVLMESVFILGPGVVSLFVAAGSPAAALLFTAFCGGLGAVVFARTEVVRSWHDDPLAEAARPGLLAVRNLLPIFAVTLFFSAGFGLFEVAVAALATRAEEPAAAGLILALTSVGSAAGALVYGSRSWPLQAAGQYKAALAAMAVGLALLAPIGTLWLFALVAIVAGIPMATVLAVQSMLIATIAPRAALAECFTWASTSLLLGVSVGIAFGGWLLERLTPAATLAAAAAATLCALGIAAYGVHPPAPVEPVKT